MGHKWIYREFSSLNTRQTKQKPAGMFCVRESDWILCGKVPLSLSALKAASQGKQPYNKRASMINTHSATVESLSVTLEHIQAFRRKKKEITLERLRRNCSGSNLRQTAAFVHASVHKISRFSNCSFTWRHELCTWLFRATRGLMKVWSPGSPCRLSRPLSI